MENGNYAAARSEIERFFWSDFCDNYLELAKARLYKEYGEERVQAQWTLYHALLTVLKLLAPYLPFVTEEIYQELFRKWDSALSIHISDWPIAPEEWINSDADFAGKLLLEILHAVRRQKADLGISVGAQLASLQIFVAQAHISLLEALSSDIQSATRAQELVFSSLLKESERDLQPLQVKLVLLL
ncbi:hypothetical protein KDI_51100 [Dictyobacter arantiisoli]|uniref:valine--tRNA ligase n=1 Tax=Dictyobacter arantiisoli TaxID=2014874 RepID=A0A5A5TKD8_9CHLR|nr:hypothetical protein KDI_51100 [Dictyobacter arantiisoli]